HDAPEHCRGRRDQRPDRARQGGRNRVQGDAEQARRRTRLHVRQAGRCLRQPQGRREGRGTGSRGRLMDALRVSATDLDQLRYYRDADEMELAELIARLKHLMPSSESMEAGTALHKALETAEPGEHKGFAVDGFTFSFDTDAEIDLPPLREMKATMQIDIGGTLVTL